MNISFLAKSTAGASPTQPVIIKAPPVVIKVPPRVVNGRSLAHQVAGKSPTERALILADNHSALLRPTVKQWALITGANLSYAHAAIKLGSDERRLVDAGLRPMIPVQRGAPAAPKSDAETVAEIVGRVGVDRALEMIVAVEVKSLLRA